MRTINISNKKILFIWLLTIYIVIAQDSIAPIQHKTVVQANHYFSDTQKKAIYTIANVEEAKSLIFVLRDKQTSESSQKINRNPLNVTLTSGSKKSQCFFDSYDSLCVIDQVIDKLNMQMIIECKNLPCDISWTIFQPKAKIPTINQPLQQLYELSDSNKHMIAIVSCNDPAVKDFSNDIVVYSDNPFTRSAAEKVVYYLFNNQKKGYMFAEVGQRTRHCATLGMYNVSQQIKTSLKEQKKDFIRNDSLSIFKLDQNPSTDFEIDCSMHELNKTKNMKSPLDIKLTGIKNNQRQTITQYLVKPFLKKPNFSFKFLIKKVATQYSDLQFQFKSNGDIIMLNFKLISDNRFSIKVGDLTYFNLKKGQNLLYKFEGNPEQNQETLSYIYPSNKNSLSVDLQSCKSKTGCQFELKCIQDMKGSLYLGQQKTQNEEQIIYSQLKNTVTKRGRQGDNDYYKIPLKSDKAFQLVVNSPNVIVYASTSVKCTKPSSECYQKVLNIHHPFIYEPQKDGQLMLNVQVLDTCQYTLTVIQQGTDIIQLKDGIPFSYLFDDHQDSILFKFKLQKKQQINFNLIAPLNSLYLLVQNGVKKPSEKQLNIASTDGFISFDKSDIDSLEFRILIKKTDVYMDKFVHFSLIASTKDSNLRLQPGIAHYETLQPNAHRDFAFQFQPKNDYIVTFNSYNLKGTKIQIQLLVSSEDEWKNSKDIEKFVIDKQIDTLQLKDVSQSLCQKEGDQICEIFIRLINPMNIQIDLTINLLVKNSIIQLKDGIWQSYGQSAVVNTAKFYFYPKHRNKSISISYKSLFTDLRILYSIWKADDKNINPTQWPFPKVARQTQQAITLFKPVKHISIDHAALKQCWPSCVILISLLKNSTQVKGQYLSTIQYGDFSIMASNSLIQIPQKDKMDIVLKSNQEKFFMIDLKYMLDKQDAALTLFTYTTIGFFQITGNVYSQKNPRCPQGNGDSDFRFGNVETQIKLATIKDKLKQNEMQDDRNVYICLLTKAYSDTKMSIQYTADQGMIKLLDLDSIQKVQIKKGQSKIFQLSANQEYYVKITRNQGFPFISFAKCTEGNDYQKCMDNFMQQKEKGKQLLSKTQSFTEQPCNRCIIFIKVETQEPAQIEIHLQSKYIQMELKQNQMVSDFTNLGEQNRYLITALRKEETVINIQVMEGDIQVQVTDFNKINIKKSNDKDSKIIHIVIPVQDHQLDLKTASALTNLGQGWMTAFGLSDTFSYLHLTVKAKDGKGATSYTITYSSGQRQIYLQDGLMADYNLQPEKQTTFYYENKAGQGHVYLYVSMTNSASLFNLQMKMYYLVDPEDQDTAVQITPQKPPMRKKTPSPTMLFSLPAQKFFIIKAKNPNNKEETFTIGINHQEVIYLPFNHDFPFSLHKSESINLLVDVNNPGYLKITIRKCDESNPKFGYTFDYDSFQKAQFTYQSVLNQDPKFQYYIKSKQVGTLYMNFQTQPEDDSLLSIEVQYSPEKLKSSGVKPGNKGQLDYQLLDSNTAELMFTGVVCSKSTDCQEYQYYTISSLKQQDLYTQIVCPSTYFSMFEATSVKPLPLNKIKQSADSNGKIVFKYTLLDHISYVGIKGISKKSGQQIYYRPVQIVTMWGQISRTSTSHKLTIFGVSICMICTLLIWVRRNARKGYVVLPQAND